MALNPRQTRHQLIPVNSWSNNIAHSLNCSFLTENIIFDSRILLESYKLFKGELNPEIKFVLFERTLKITE